MNKVMLVIRDGWGYSENAYGNAVLKANTPNDDAYIKKYPHCIIKCTGNDVWNPEGVQWWSEVGHLTIGAGRIVWQPYELINQEIKNWWFFKNEALLGAINHCKKNNTNLHLNWLFSDQGIHGDFRHMFAILQLCKQENFDRVYIHITSDWRDVPEKSVSKFLDQAEEVIAKIWIGKIISIIGRYYSMDRDTNRDRTEIAYQLMVQGKWFKAKSAREAIKAAYERWDKTDYYIQPTIIVDEKDEPVCLLKENDGFIRYNFRTDRSLQITAMMNGFSYCPKFPENMIKTYYVWMTQYDDSWNIPIAFQQLEVKNDLGEYLSTLWLKQLRIAENEKYAHVTFFFNGQKDKINKGEERICIASKKCKSYDEKPEMSAYEITEALLPKIGQYDFILVNYANPDVVWHAGIFDAVVKACEVVDECVGKIVNKATECWYSTFLMADHGNAEHKLYDNGEKDVSHGFNPVRLTVISDQKYTLKDGWMSDIAPTILKFMWLDIPKEMTGTSLITE